MLNRVGVLKKYLGGAIEIGVVLEKLAGVGGIIVFLEIFKKEKELRLKSPLQWNMLGICF